MKKFISIGAVLGAIPVFAFAAASATSVLYTITKILNTIIPILITLAVVYFIWSVIQFTLSTDEEAKKKAKSGIVQGLIGLFVIVSFWGIIALVSNTFDIGPGSNMGNQLPTIPTSGSGTL